MASPEWTALELRKSPDGPAVGRLELREGGVHVETADPALADRLRALAARPLTWLADDGDADVQRTVRRVAEPGTPEHLRVLMFEVRSLGLEARPVRPA